MLCCRSCRCLPRSGSLPSPRDRLAQIRPPCLRQPSWREDAALQARLREQRDDVLKDAEFVGNKGLRAEGHKVTILTEDESEFELLEHAARQFEALEIFTPSEFRLRLPRLCPAPPLPSLSDGGGATCRCHGRGTSLGG